MSQYDFRGQPDSDDEPVIEFGKDGPSRSSGSSFLDRLKTEVNAEVANPPITLAVGTRKGIALRYNPNFDSNRYESWVKAASRKRKTPDSLKMACYVLAHCNEAILFENHEVHEPDNDEVPLRLASRAATDVFDVIGDYQAVIKKLFGTDPEILAHAGRVIEAAGYSQDSLDPDEVNESPLQ